MIKFYFHDTPNPRKIALFLEESGLAYEVIPVDLLKGEQHNPEYRAINPNGKAPAVVDDGIDALSQSPERRLTDSQVRLGQVPADHLHPRPDLGFESRGP